MAVSGWLSRLSGGMSKTRENLTDKLRTAVARRPAGEDEFWEEVEEILISADIGVAATVGIIQRVRDLSKERKARDLDSLSELLRESIADALRAPDAPQVMGEGGPCAVLVVGVNGTGKTTTIAKLAQSARKKGLSVLLAAADTFRAAAIEQLEVWGEREGVEVIKHERGADAAAVVYDALQAARARGTDRVFIDTAGRLHTYVNLMEELKKVKRVTERESPDGVLTLLVMDATTGQNGIAQARLFDEALGVDGVVLTKLDGTAKGGIAVAIRQELSIPVLYTGVGETAEDLHEFDADEFAAALVGGSEPEAGVA